MHHMAPGQINRNSKLGCLIALRQQGFYPSVVIDVGAQTGTGDLYHAFPDARHLMIEPVEEHRETLQKIASRLKNAEVVIAAAAAVSGETWLTVSDNARYAQMSDSGEADGLLRNVRKIPCAAVDDLCSARALTGPFVVKIDVDGRELDVLHGMTHTLAHTECVISEAVLFGDDPNTFYGIIEFMGARDFVVYDIVEPLYRPFDFALWQVDLVFVKRAGKFRRFHDYAEEAGMQQLANR